MQMNNSVFQKEESNKLEQEKNKLENLLKYNYIFNN